MKKNAFPAWLILLVLTAPAALHARDAAVPPDFWLLKGAAPTPENRLAAVQSAGRALLDFAIYQPDDEADTFPEEYRQKLLDAGFVFDFITQRQLAEAVHVWAEFHHSPVGRVAILVIPDGVTPPEEELCRLKSLCCAFLDKVSDIQEAFMEKEATSFADRKEAVEAFLQKRPSRGIGDAPRCKCVDQIGDNLGEAVGLFSGWAPAFPESFAAKTGVQVLARRGYFNDADVFYVLANTKEDARPVDGWFPLRELKPGRWLGTAIFGDGEDDWCEEYEAEDDRAFFMDPATGRIGEASVRKGSDLRIRVQMKPGETLVVRVVRERCDEDFRHLGYGEFESLPAWEYETPDN